MTLVMTLDKWGDQEAFQSWPWMMKVTKWLFNPNLENGVVYDQRVSQPQSWRKGFLTLELELSATKGLLYLNLDERQPKCFSTLELELSATKGLLYLNLDERQPKVILTLELEERWSKGFSTLKLELSVTKGLLYLNLDERQPKGFSTLELEERRSKGFSTSVWNYWDIDQRASLL